MHSAWRQFCAIHSVLFNMNISNVDTAIAKNLPDIVQPWSVACLLEGSYTASIHAVPALSRFGLHVTGVGISTHAVKAQHCAACGQFVHVSVRRVKRVCLISCLTSDLWRWSTCHHTASANPSVFASCESSVTVHTGSGHISCGSSAAFSTLS